MEPDDSLDAASYVERAPTPELVGAVRSVWIQRTRATPYVQRHLPTGGIELHFPIGAAPQLLGPLTGPSIEVIPPNTTLFGVRFHPGMAPPLPMPLHELVDERVDLELLWGDAAGRLGAAVASAAAPDAELYLIQRHLLRTLGPAGHPDPLLREAVRRLMPWHPVEIGVLAQDLGISTSQLRRRCIDLVGVSPKALQRTLRFQGFLALAQAAPTAPAHNSAHGLAGLAFDAGYADQAHLSRECVRLTGLSPSELPGGSVHRCGCGHDHAASYTSFLRNARRERRPGC
ncbi:MAG: AraC family transcriptional regulator [Chloroflexi bacterium]|nr:AraC family transcriptional regulator [Chloroflexota bacterium]